MINIGKINKLEVSKETSSGHYLGPFGEVFLPPALSDIPVNLGEEINVFVYVDTKDKLIATTKSPKAQVGEFAMLTVVDVQEFGAFFDLGIEKDLLVPANEQKIKVKKHERHLVRVCLEEGADRIFGTTKFGKYLEDCKFEDIEEGEQVKAVAVEETDLGYRVIINKKYLGLIYKNEIFKNFDMGEDLDVYVKKIRVDGFIDVALQIQGIKNLDTSKRTILAHLFKQNGRSNLHDKSTPEEISRLLGMSKKTFKNALGMLYKDRMIKINKDGIELIHKGKPSSKKSNA